MSSLTDLARNDSPDQAVPAVQFGGVCKDFGPNRVLHDVELTFRPGSIHALLGANGSGKSTLIKILAGYHAPSEGSLRLHGNEVSFPVSPHDIETAGVRFVHQDLGLVENMSVADNLGLGLGFVTSRGAIHWRQQEQAARQALETVGLHDVSPKALVKTLGPVQRTLVAMARSLQGLNPSTGVLVLDEPTARLPASQVEELIIRCKALRDQDLALIYVSHRLEEVFAMADHVSVLRNGHLVFSQSVKDTNPSHLAALITGGDELPTVAESVPRQASARVSDRREEPVLRVENVSGLRTRNLNFEIRPGEIVALTGLIGSGCSEVGRLIYGEQSTTAGTITLDGSPLDAHSPHESLARGMGYVPQDRKQASVAAMAIYENVTQATLPRHMRGGFLSRRHQMRAAVGAIRELDIRPPDPLRLLKELSGGNQQKVILAKWLELDLKLLVLDEPAYGVDVGARKLIMDKVVEQARSRGMAVLHIDSDVDLVAQYADRVLVLNAGRLIDELTGPDVNSQRIAAAAYAVA